MAKPTIRAFAKGDHPFRLGIFLHGISQGNQRITVSNKRKVCAANPDYLYLLCKPDALWASPQTRATLKPELPFGLLQGKAFDSKERICGANTSYQVRFANLSVSNGEKESHKLTLNQSYP